MVIPDRACRSRLVVATFLLTSLRKIPKVRHTRNGSNERNMDIPNLHLNSFGLGCWCSPPTSSDPDRSTTSLKNCCASIPVPDAGRSSSPSPTATVLCTVGPRMLMIATGAVFVQSRRLVAKKKKAEDEGKDEVTKADGGCS